MNGIVLITFSRAILMFVGTLAIAFASWMILSYVFVNKILPTMLAKLGKMGLFGNDYDYILLSYASHYLMKGDDWVLDRKLLNRICDIGDLLFFNNAEKALSDYKRSVQLERLLSTPNFRRVMKIFASKKLDFEKLMDCSVYSISRLNRMFVLYATVVNLNVQHVTHIANDGANPIYIH